MDVMGQERDGRNGVGKERKGWDEMEQAEKILVSVSGIALGLGLWDANTTATCECCLCSTLALNIVTFVPKHFIFFILLNDILMSVWDTEVHLINSTLLHPASAPCNLDELICQSRQLLCRFGHVFCSHLLGRLFFTLSAVSLVSVLLDWMGASPAKQQC